MKTIRTITLVLLLTQQLISCGNKIPVANTDGHLNNQTEKRSHTNRIPPIVENTLSQNRSGQHHKVETYSVIVHKVPAHDLLFALARDAKVNLDIHPGISGEVSLNAVQQTLPQILSRLARQIDMRFELDGPNLAVMPDTPFLRHYRMDYVNLARTTTGTVSANTQINNAAASSSQNNSAPGSPGNNVSNTRIENHSKHHFWENLEKNIKDILRETDKTLPEGSSETLIEQNTNQNATGGVALTAPASRRHQAAIPHPSQLIPPGSSQASGNALIRRNTYREAASVISNPESGLITVRATSRQHERIQEFLDRVSQSIRRQVMIEATIVEVELSEGYRQGIEWSRLREDGSGFSIAAPGTSGSIAGAANLIVRQLDKPLNLLAAVNLLESFGTTKVLSSPRLAVLNNQTALLKVVENYVYFQVKADTTTTANVGTTTTYTTTPQTVSVGLVVGVTPQISEAGEITLNIRPTITSIAREIRDPNPTLTIENRVPVIRTREIESVMRVTSGDIAILGGLMEDRLYNDSARLPVAGQIPLAGELVTRRDQSSRKAELVIFLRPIITGDARQPDRLQTVSKQLPGRDFFAARKTHTAPSPDGR